MAFSIEKTYDGRGLFEENCISSGTLTSGELVALTKGASKPTATACAATAKPDAIVVQGGLTGTACTFVRILPGDIMTAPALAADGTTALSAAEITALKALVGSQAQRLATGSLAMDCVTEAGGKMELISFDEANLKVRVRFTIAS